MEAQATYDRAQPASPSGPLAGSGPIGPGKGNRTANRGRGKAREYDDAILLRCTREQHARWRARAEAAGVGLPELREALLDLAPENFIDSPAIVGDLVGPGELAVLAKRG